MKEFWTPKMAPHHYQKVLVLYALVFLSNLVGCVEFTKKPKDTQRHGKSKK